MMGGELEFESEEGKGTTFYATLEFGQLDGAPHAVAHADASLQGVHVLVVDDNATNRFILEEVLTNWSMKVTSVDGAEPALAALRAGEGADSGIQVGLLDVMMPRTDGLMLAERIREDSKLDGVPLILLSSAYSKESAARCKALGIVAQLRKPAKQSELLDALQLALQPERPAREVTPPSPVVPPTRPVRILLAEDGAVNRHVAIGLLEEQGHDVTAVGDGREAVAAWQEGEFDLILMDLEMPDMDGLEATRCIRRAEQGGETRVPIVALTAHAISDYEDRCMEAGMDAHVAKPFDPERLYATIREMTNAN
jgi:CheY-like chemotaxis protein